MVKDNKFKYGLSGKWMVDGNELFCQLKRDVEQIGASLTTTNDVLGEAFSSSLFSCSNSKLTNII
jgi:hypothetical protein